jgi:sulfopyruvate decarboxylase subunit alpha
MAQARLVLDALRRHAVTDVVSLPDNSSAALLVLLRESADIRLLSVTREGEAFALAAGLWMGGRNPLVLIQNTGLLESGDSLRGTLLRMRIPVVCLVTYRGYAKLLRWGASPPEPSPEILSRPELDSVAVMTEPTLRAWGVPFDFLHTDSDISRISAAFAQAQQSSAPAAVLVTQNMS